jgi:hypothetical protein
VSEYLDTLGLVKSYFFKFFIEKKSRKKNVLVLRRPEDEAISLFAGLLANPDVPLSQNVLTTFWAPDCTDQEQFI